MKKIRILECTKSDTNFFDHFNNAIYALDICDKDKIPLTIDFSKNNNYTDKSLNWPNFWEYYFNQPFGLNIPENKIDYSIEKIKTVVSTNENLTFKHIKNYGRLVKKYITLKPNIKEAISHFYKEKISGNKVLCVYFDSNISLKNYFDKIDIRINDYDFLYISSTDQIVIESTTKRYKEKVIYYDYNRNNTFKSSYMKGQDELIDVLIMSKCNYMLKTFCSTTTTVLYFSPKLQFENI